MAIFLTVNQDQALTGMPYEQVFKQTATLVLGSSEYWKHRVRRSITIGTKGPHEEAHTSYKL